MPKMIILYDTSMLELFMNPVLKTWLHKVNFNQIQHGCK